MNNFTMNTYEMKREIVNFSKKVCISCNKPTSKFLTDMAYGILKSKDILLYSICDLLDKRNLKGTFVNDRGYDNNKIFNHYFDKKQYFIIRLKENRKLR